MSRRRVFVLGVLGSLILAAVFVGGAVLQVEVTGDGPGRLNWIYKSLVAMFLIINPVLAIVLFGSAALPSSVSQSQVGQLVLAATSLVAFFGGWWLVAGVLVWMSALWRRRQA